MLDSPHPSGPLLTVSGLGVDFNVDARPRSTVRDVALQIASGQIMALVGESGSGKSVTALSLLGLLPDNATVRGSALLASGTDAASIELVGADHETLRRVRGRRIGAVFQDPFTNFNPVLRVGAQIVEALAPSGRAARTIARERAVELLGRVGLSDPRRAFRSFPHELSGGQLQRAMVAAAICHDPELLIADEPTTALDVTVQAGILELLHELRQDLGMAILLITHDMGVVADLADDIAVMHDGEIVEAGSATEIFTAPAKGYTRELLQAVPRIDTPSAARPPAAVSGEAAAVVDNVTIAYGSRRHPFVAVRDVSFVVPRGQTVGLVGESGSGKTTVGKALARLLPLVTGKITVAGRELSTLGAAQLRAARAGIGFVFQNPGDSLNPRVRVAGIIAEPLRLHSKMSRAEQDQRGAEMLERVHLPAEFAQRFPHQLSGGQRQRVAIARALVLGPALVIADEPTSALDVVVQARILELFAELQEAFQFGCLFISHDLAVVRQVSHQLVVMHSGHVVETGTTDAVLSEPRDDYTRTLLAAIPVPDPEAQRARRKHQLAATT